MNSSGKATLASNPPLPVCNAPEEIMDAVAALCLPHPGAQEINLFCHNGDQVFCMVSATSQTNELAQALNGTATSNMVGVFIPVTAAFRCAKRSNGRLTVASCDDCRRPLAAAGERK